MHIATHRFKLTIGSEELKFNHHVQVDKMWIYEKSAVHMLDTAAHVIAERFVKRQNEMEFWRAIR